MGRRGLLLEGQAVAKDRDAIRQDRRHIPRVHQARQHHAMDQIVKSSPQPKQNRKTVDQLAPFFPRYAFVKLDLWRDRWRSVLGTFGVTTLIIEKDVPELHRRIW